MIEGLNTPEDWSVADKDSWVAEQVFSREAKMPVLEGWDVVGFSESASFAAIKLAPDKPENATEWTDEKGRPVKYNPVTRAWFHIDSSGRKDLQAKIKADKQQSQSQSTSPSQQRQKPKPKPEPKPEPETKPKPQEEQKSSDRKIQEQSTSSNHYALDRSSAESIERVQKIGSAPATDPRFRPGQVAFKQIDEHYSQASPTEEALSRLSDQGGNRIMNALISNPDLDQRIKIKKNTFITPREVLKEAGLDTDNPESVRNVISLLKSLNSHLDSAGNWSTSPTHSLSEGLGFFEAEHIQHRSDMADSDTSVSDIRVKAFSNGADFEDSSSWASMSPQEIDVVYHLLPTNARKTLRESGSPNTYYNPLSPEGQTKTAPDLRGRLALFMWAKQGGRDGYCLSGMQRSPGEFQVEHIEDLSSGGKDTASNFVMLLRRVNQPRSNTPLPGFVEFASKRAKEIEKNLSDPDGAFLQTRLRALRQKGLHDTMSKALVTNANSTTISSFSSPQFFKTLQKNSNLLPSELRLSQEELDSFVEEINSIADPNTKISDLRWPQLEQLISAAEKIGADPQKIKEYIGRSAFNNYDDGNRTVIRDGRISLGRGGSNPAPASLVSLENRMLGRPKTVSPEDYQAGLASIAKAHDAIRAARNALIDRKGQDTSQFHKVLSESLMTICGLDDNSPDWVRNRKIRMERDLVRTIEGYIKSFPPDKPVEGNLAGIYLSAAMDYYKGFTTDHLNNPELIRNGGLRKQALKIKSILDQIRGVSQP